MIKVSWRCKIIHSWGKAIFDISGMGSITKRLFSAIAICTCLVFPISAVAEEQRGIAISSERQALVIGNNAYQTAPLKNPANDAEDMSRVLSELGFRVTLQKNVDRRAMEDAIRGFGRQLRNGGVGLFYFAGHGIQVEGRNYLIPINARIESESDVKYEAVDAGLVLGKMEDAKNQLNIIILDACRNNPYARRFRSENMGLARMDAPTGSLIVYATAPGDVASDGPERNGVFTKHLLKQMQTPNLPIEQVLKRVRIDVASETRQRQIPWESSSLMGDFYFKTEAIAESIVSPPIVDAQENSVKSIDQVSKIVVSEQLPKVGISKLAIFPLNFSDFPATGWNRSQYDAIKIVTIEHLSKLLEKSELFVAVYSYYDLGGKLPYKKITSSVIKDSLITKLWLRKSVFEKFEELDIDLAINLGQELKVDYIFTCDGRQRDFIIYFLDVNLNKIYRNSYSYDLHSGYSEAPRYLNDFFINYKNYPER